MVLSLDYHSRNSANALGTWVQILSQLMVEFDFNKKTSGIKNLLMTMKPLLIVGKTHLVHWYPFGEGNLPSLPGLAYM